MFIINNEILYFADTFIGYIRAITDFVILSTAHIWSSLAWILPMYREEPISNQSLHI